MNLKSKTLDWALKHCETIGHLNLFPLPFEFKAIRQEWGKVKDRLLKINFPNNWIIGQCRIIFAPKHHYGFRICTQLNPLDEIIYTGLVYEIGEALEKYRIEKSRKIVISNRFKPTNKGEFWDPDYNFSTFEILTDEMLEVKKHTYVVEADIADFFPRIYTHKLNHSLHAATHKLNHIQSIEKLLSDIYQTVSYGIPVGSDASFLLAENLLHQVDERLLDEDTQYLRFVDDFRIFCKNKAEAYEKLNFLAETIFNLLSLTLQQHKTKIYTKKRYKDKREQKNVEVGPLSKKFRDFAKNNLKISNPYAAINVSQLTSEQKKELEDFEFEEIIKEQTKKELINIPLVRYALKRLIQINSSVVIDDIFRNLEKFYPVINNVIFYLISIRNLSPPDKTRIGKMIINLIKNSYLGHSEFNRMWLLHCFTQDTEWDCEDEFLKLYKNFDDISSRRKLILAMGRANKSSWFSSEKRNILQELRNWDRRAFLAALSCVQEDERTHWYDSLKKNPSLDFLDRIVIQWAQKNHF